MDLREEFDELGAALAQERDHLKVRAHLLKAELRDEWEEAEHKWDSFQSKAKHVTKAGQESVADIAGVVRDLGHELHEAYKRIKQAL